MAFFATSKAYNVGIAVGLRGGVGGVGPCMSVAVVDVSRVTALLVCFVLPPSLSFGHIA